MCERDGADVCTNCHYRHGTPADTALVLQPCTKLTSNYLVGKKLGQGGFGITYIGYDFAAKLRVAIKEYFPREISTRAGDGHTVSPISREYRNDLDYGLRKFEEEARAIAQLRNHPGIVSFLDFFKTNGTAYIVMGYVDGDTLRKHLKDRGERIPFEAAWQILSQVMKALEDVHRANLLHRDISPENIYIERSGNVILIDFGAAKQALGEQSQSLSVILKPGYAPEEQYRRRGRQGPYTDIYALGATFYRCITGGVPSESLERAQHDDLVPPRRLGVSMPPPSEAALLKALAVKAENRFQSVLEFRRAISPRGIDGDTIPPPPRPVVIHKPGLLAGLLVSFAVMLGLNLAGDFYPLFEFFPLLVIFVLMLFVFQRMWKSIQDGHARTSPDNALAFCFIPLFNLYWAFPVLWGFAVDYNRYLDRHHLEHEKLPEGAFLAASVAFVATWIITPIAQSLTFFSLLILVNAVLLSIVVARACDAVNALGPSSQQSKTPSHVIAPPARTLFLYGLAGQYEGQQLEVNQTITIGRNSRTSNLVIASDEISSTHVKIWRDPSTGSICIEDLKSTNGTFYRKSTSGSTGWTRLTGTIQLDPGDSFQLSEGKAVFEVRS